MKKNHNFFIYEHLFACRAIIKWEVHIMINVLKRLNLPFFCKKSDKYKKNRKKVCTNDFGIWYDLDGNRGVSKGGRTRMISVQALSNTILKKSFDEDIPVSPMKLQKLIYFIYRDYLQSTGSPLFTEEFQTWQYGPVLRSVYDEFKTFKAKPITRFAKTANNEVYVINEAADEDLCASINNVWGKYKYGDGISLSKITHLEGSAWRKAYESQRLTLDDEDIKNDYVG